MAEFHDMRWLNPPPRHRIEGDVLEIETAAATDFWQTTYYGFTPDSGHALLAPVRGDFTAELTVAGDYAALYDQAGLLLRQDARHWIKTGVEVTDGAAHLSVVVTREVSDWSTVALADAGAPVDLRLSRMGDAIFIQFRTGDAPWRMARLAPWPVEPAEVEIGPMACSPQRAGFVARLSNFRLGPLASRDIH